MDDSKDIADAHPYLQECWPKILLVYENLMPGKTLTITCTYRSPETQNKLFQQGRNGVPGDIVTQLDGINHKSNHNVKPSRAIDVSVNSAPVGMTKVAPIWDEHYYYPLVKICQDLGLISGGSWKHFIDWPHIELPKDFV